MATWAEFFLAWNGKQPYPPLGQERVPKSLV